MSFRGDKFRIARAVQTSCIGKDPVAAYALAPTGQLWSDMRQGPKQEGHEVGRQPGRLSQSARSSSSDAAAGEKKSSEVVLGAAWYRQPGRVPIPIGPPDDPTKVGAGWDPIRG
ncbi:hypothetical protein TWF281_006067 [Arthrobotrys megalospora]